jgi:tetratricopeptide (TPR) repeat protein
MPRSRPKDVDSAERLYRARVLVYALVTGPIFGGVAGFFVARGVGIDPFIGVIVGIPLGVAAVYCLALGAVRGAAKTMEQIYNPSGATTPPKREYSYAQSLAVQGRYQEAIEAYELAVIEDPRDPTPYFEVARLYRDKLNQPEDAITWFRRARADAALASGHELLAIQEIVELYLHKLRKPRKAIPEMALLVERFPGTPAGRAARAELAAMRQLLAEEHAGTATFTEQFLERMERRSLSKAAGLTREEIERKMIVDALASSHGDRQRAADRLQVPLEKLEAAMRNLGIESAPANGTRGDAG